MGKKSVSKEFERLEKEEARDPDLFSKILAYVGSLTPEELNQERKKARDAGLSADDWVSNFCKQDAAKKEAKRRAEILSFSYSHKQLQEYFYDIARALNFIKEAILNEDALECQNRYTFSLVRGMIEALMQDVESFAGDVA